MKRSEFLLTAGAMLASPLAYSETNRSDGKRWTERHSKKGDIHFIEFYMDVSQSPVLEFRDAKIKKRAMAPFFDLSKGDDIMAKAIDHCFKAFENQGLEAPKYCHIIRVNGRPDIAAIICHPERLQPITNFYERIVHPQNPPEWDGNLDWRLTADSLGIKYKV